MSKDGNAELALTKALSVGKYSGGVKAFLNQHAKIGVGGAIEIGSYQVGMAVSMNDLKTMMIGLSEALRKSSESPIGIKN